MSGNDETDHHHQHHLHQEQPQQQQHRISNDEIEITSSSEPTITDKINNFIDNEKKPEQLTAPPRSNNLKKSAQASVPMATPITTAHGTSNWVQFGDDENMNVNEIAQSNVSNVKTSDNDTSSAAVLSTESVHINIDNNKKQKLDVAPSPNRPIPAARPTTAAVLTTESVHVNINNSTQNPTSKQITPMASPSVIDIPPSYSNNNITPAQAAGLRTIELSTGRIREGFANGDIIVTLLPINTKWPWITPAIFRPELVPEELMAQGLTLTVEEYVHAMETLVNDVRFTLYNICYKRVLVCWILFAFIVLIGLLFSGLVGITLFSLGVAWLFLNAAAIFFCMWIKLRLSRGLERCLASVNKQLLRHKIILALDDRGKISCHKVNLCFMYYEPSQCINYLNEFIERNEQNGTAIEPGWESRLDVQVNDIVIQGSNTTRVSRKQAVGEQIFLRYLQRWCKDFLRRRLDWIVEENGMHETPRHLQSSICPCQYAEEILHNKPRRRDKRACCATINNFCAQKGFSLC